MAKLSGLYRPDTLAEALALLAQDCDAKPLSGGATLVAMMNARVIEPGALVSLSRIAGLRGITATPDGGLRIGAYTRHCETAADERLHGELTVVRAAASQIANATVRNMGTIGGALGFADPGLDYPPALVAADARIEIASAHGARVLSAADYFVDWYTTALQPGEIVTAVLLPKPRGGRGGYHKLARVAGDYAIASVAWVSTRDGSIRAAIGACGPRPIHSDAVDAMLTRERGPGPLRQAARILVDLSDPVDDVRGSAAYRRLLIPRLLQQALSELGSP